MRRRAETASAAILAALCADPATRLVATPEGAYRIAGGKAARVANLSEGELRRLLAAGLLSAAGHGAFAATSAALAWLKRREDAERPFRAQHGTLAKKKRDRRGVRVVVDLD